MRQRYGLIDALSRIYGERDVAAESLRDFPSALLEHRTSPVLSDRLSVAGKQRKKPTSIFCSASGIFLLLAEIYKQLFYTFYIGKGNYQFDRIPFQLCSMSMYLCLIAPWLKQGRLKQTLYTFIASFGFMGGFVSYFSPESMCLNYWALTLHSFTWHMLLIFLGLYLFFTDGGKRTERFPPGDRYVPRFLRDGFLHQSCLLSLSRQRR